MLSSTGEMAIPPRESAETETGALVESRDCQERMPLTTNEVSPAPVLRKRAQVVKNAPVTVIAEFPQWIIFPVLWSAVMAEYPPIPVSMEAVTVPQPDVPNELSQTTLESIRAHQKVPTLETRAVPQTICR